MNSVKVQGTKLTYKKSVTFLYTDSELSGREFKGKKITYNCIKKNKMPRNKSRQGVKDFYTEDYKKMMKEIRQIHRKRYSMFMD